jgi:glycosyltransferase involved in cell wall biosynthesis
MYSLDSNQIPVIYVIIPAYNEEKSIGLVINALPKDLIAKIIVTNNASTDETATVANQHGTIVLDEMRKGYGSACLCAIHYIRKLPILEQPDVVVFLDADFSDYPEELPKLVHPIVQEGYDLVIGSRVSGAKLSKGAMTPQQVFGNWLATKLIYRLYGYSFTDLGPFRAIRWQALLDLDMQDTNFGWTVEMQVKAAKKKLHCLEIPVQYRPRIGVSKISGTVRGTILAGYKILWTIFKYL